MNCLHAEQLMQDSLDGALTSAGRADLDCHLADCGTCQTAFSEYRALARAAHAWSAPKPGDPTESQAFVAAVLQAARSAPVRESGLVGRWAAAGLAAAAMIGVSAYFGPDLAGTAGLLPSPAHPLDLVNSLIQSIQSLPGDVLQSTQTGISTTNTHVRLDIVAAAAIIFNGIFMLRALAADKNRHSRAEGAHG